MSSIYDLKERFKSSCDHCGNTTFKTVLHIDIKNDTVHRFARCEICEGVILQQLILILDRASTLNPIQPPLKEFQYKVKKITITQLWPAPLNLPPEVPERIREIYEEAQSVRKLPSAFAVQIRRALEAVTSDKNAKGKVLAARIDWLIKEGHLPAVFGKMSHISRMIGNWGAHDAETDVQLEDAKIVDEFFRAVVEYLYIAPARVAKVAALVEKKRDSR